MDTICLASLAWIRHRGQSEALIARVAAAVRALPTSLHLDLVSVLREQPSERAGLHKCLEIPFSDWIKDGVTEDGILDIEKIRHAAHDFPSGGIVIINAAGHKSDIVVPALHQARLALYPLTEWPAVWVLVVDDAQMFQVSPILAGTFHLQPNVLVHTAIQRETRQFMQYTGLLRLFGRNVGVVARLLRMFVDRSNRAREQRVNRGLGWTWEE